MIAAPRILPCSLLFGVTAGCAQTPPAPFREPSVQVTTDQGVRVTAATFELDFAATGIHMPERLLVNHSDVLGAIDPCQGENRIGIWVKPAIQASAGGSAGSSDIAVLASGPAMAKVRVTYEINYSCPTNERLTGTTEFTILPAGRIVREDIDIKPSSNPLSLGGQCGCAQPTDTDLFFSSFWAFAAGGKQVLADGSKVDVESDAVYEACTTYDHHAIGVAWQRIGTTHSRAERPVHVLNWPMTDHKMLEATPQSVTSAIQISATPLAQDSDCGELIDRLADVPLTIGAMRFAATDHDGIYRDPAIHNAAFDIAAGDVAVPAGFAISVDLGGASHAVITRDGEPLQAAVVQREAGNRFVIAFGDGLALGEHVTIEPRS